MGHESQMNHGCHLTNVLLAGFGTDRLRCKKAMKTAGRENPNRWAAKLSNRATGAEDQNRSCSGLKDFVCTETQQATAASHFAYSALACFKMGISVPSFQSVR